MNALIAYVLGMLTAIMSLGKKQNTANHSDPKTTEESNPSPRASGAVPQVPPSPQNENKTAEKHNWWPKKFKDWVEILGVAILLIYTIYTIKLYYVAREANQQTRELSQLQNRPWVGFDSGITITHPARFQFFPTLGYTLLLDVSFPIKNSGNSPAFRAYTLAGIVVVDDPKDTKMRLDLEMKSLCYGVEANSKDGSGSVLLPNGKFVVQSGAGTSVSKSTTEIRRVWLVVCTVYYDSANNIHFTKATLRSAFPSGSSPSRALPDQPLTYMPIASFEVENEEAN